MQAYILVHAYSLDIATIGIAHSSGLLIVMSYYCNTVTIMASHLPPKESSTKMILNEFI